ncbi:MAG TPA: MBL fold metallo-hydrolase [Candidatus Thermoplasmatota archaeon]|nr:MBL fold metallo-hydrolase [Candidatus Thermoplasmatota archaeon]
MAATISVEALRERLDKGEKLTVLDVRDAEDYEEWRIPGALHCDAYEALSAGDPGPVATAEVPRDRPVVAVCYAGVTSRIAAEALRQRGLDAVSLEGGMNAWSVAWNTAEVSLPGAQARILQVRRTGKGCLSYVVASEGEAAVVDPSVDAGVYLELAKRNGWRITRVVETHVHADHLSRARALAASTGATLHLPRTDRVAFWHEGVDEGTRIRVGRSELLALRTPGHTPESTCYQLEGRALLTGDTLFLDAVGRPDLEADPQQARARAVALHASLQRLLRLPPETLVLPAHAGTPIAFDKRPVVAELRQVRGRTPTLALARDEFVARLMRRLPPAPPNHHVIVKANEAGDATGLDAARLEAGANRCAAR